MSYRKRSTHIYELDKVNGPVFTPRRNDASMLLKGVYRGTVTCPVCKLQCSRAEGEVTKHFRENHKGDTLTQKEKGG